MAGLVPAIHVFLLGASVKTWMPGTRPGMTESADAVMAGRSHSKNGVASPPMSRPSTSCLLRIREDVDARDKRGHDGVGGCRHGRGKPGHDGPPSGWRPLRRWLVCAPVVCNKGGTMLRFAVSLLVGLFFFGSANAQIIHDPTAKTVGERSREARAERQAKIRALIAANKLPAVRLSEAQVARLKAIAPAHRAAWYGAGRQSDGKTFVCLVIDEKTIFGRRAVVVAGTFEPDGSFQQTLSRFHSTTAVVIDCQKHGFSPPVVVKGA